MSSSQNISSAIILSAGYGKRLQPLTFFYPKPMIPLNGTPSISFVINYLKKFSVENFYINSFYKTEILKKYLLNQNERIAINEEKKLLGTAGGMRHFLNQDSDDNLVVINSDIITDINLKSVMKLHIKKNSLVTMVLINHPGKNTVKIRNNKVYSFAVENSKNAYCFSGLSIVSKELMFFLEKYKYKSIIEVYKNIIRNENEFSIDYFIPKERFFWFDIGTLSDYYQAVKYLLNDSKVDNIVWDKVQTNNFVNIEKAIMPSTNIIIFPEIEKFE